MSDKTIVLTLMAVWLAGVVLFPVAWVLLNRRYKWVTKGDAIGPVGSLMLVFLWPLALFVAAGVVLMTLVEIAAGGVLPDKEHKRQ